LFVVRNSRTSVVICPIFEIIVSFCGQDVLKSNLGRHN
jgi:hypothetical protein